MTRRRWMTFALGVVAVVAALGYLHDPPWIRDVTSGMRSWEQEAGIPFRWTTGRSTFFIPSTATSMTLPLRAVFPGPNGTPVRVEVLDNGRLIGTIELTDPAAWVKTTMTLRPAESRRRYRRIDLRVSRVIPPFLLGVMVGVVDDR
jgi:hypothetical protein